MNFHFEWKKVRKEEKASREYCGDFLCKKKGRLPERILMDFYWKLSKEF